MKAIEKEPHKTGGIIKPLCGRIEMVYIFLVDLQLGKLPVLHKNTNFVCRRSWVQSLTSPAKRIREQMTKEIPAGGVVLS